MLVKYNEEMILDPFYDGRLLDIDDLQEILDAYKDKGHVFVRKLKRNLWKSCPTCGNTVDDLFTKEKCVISLYLY